MKKLLSMILAVMMLVSVAACAMAAYPEHELTLVIPYGAGGTTDVYARKLASLLEAELGVAITPSNMAGASGSNGAAFVKEQAADGYTIMVCAETMGTYRTMGVSELGYDDFTVISPLVGDPKVIVVGKDSPYNTMDELLAAIKANPGALTMSHSGPGGSGQNQGLVLGVFGYDVAMINSNSGNQALLDVVGGMVDFTNPNISTLGGYLESGDVKPLAVFSNTRLAAYPEIPAFTEFVPEAEQYVNIPYTVLSLVVDNKVPQEEVDTLRAACQKVFAGEEWTAFVEGNAGDKLYEMYQTPEEQAAFYTHWQSIVCWMQYDNKVAPNSPADFGIERP